MISSNNEFIFVKSSQDEYIYKDGEKSQWLFNSEWKIKPSIIFVEGEGPSVMTCHNHNHGTHLLIIYTYCTPFHILPALRSDQIYRAVIKRRTIKPIKVLLNLTTFQMHEQRGIFNGIDTCIIIDHGDFDFNSKVIQEAEDRSLINQPDISSHIT